MTGVVTQQMIDEWSERYSNWQRWGADDSLGTLNFITRERVRTACALPRSGRTLSCALPYAAESDNVLDRSDPIETGWTALTHVAHDGRSYNDRACTDAPNSLVPARDRVIGRGVLLDLPRYTRLPWLEDGTRITPHDLDLCAESFGVSIERGDILLVRTGQLRRCREQRRWERVRAGPAPGLALRCARWIFEREIAALATDTFDLEVRPNETEFPQSLRRLAVRDTGLLVGSMFDLEELADACAEDGNYAFLFVAPPLPVAHSDRARSNPIAIK
jgi:kynurenine formamidase